jgi:hypothetical protein
MIAFLSGFSLVSIARFLGCFVIAVLLMVTQHTPYVCGE